MVPDASRRSARAPDIVTFAGSLELPIAKLPRFGARAP
jgi:hypothetical protein